VAGALLVAAAPVAAHTGVKSISPKAGSTVSRTSAKWVRVTFRGRIADGKLTVRSQDGRSLTRGAAGLVNGGRVLRVRLASGLPRGRATVRMQVLNTDGHVTTRTWWFRLR
jgi:methionine-rich copper-binding protein CopC